MTRDVTDIDSDLARAVMHPNGETGPGIDRLAQAAYEAHHIGLCGEQWNDLPDASRERWRWAVRNIFRVARSNT